MHVSISRTEIQEEEAEESINTTTVSSICRRDADPAAHPEAARLHRPRGHRCPGLRGCCAGKVSSVRYLNNFMTFFQ